MRLVVLFIYVRNRSKTLGMEHKVADSPLPRPSSPIRSSPSSGRALTSTLLIHAGELPAGFGANITTARLTLNLAERTISRIRRSSIAGSVLDQISRPWLQLSSSVPAYLCVLPCRTNISTRSEQVSRSANGPGPRSAGSVRRPPRDQKLSVARSRPGPAQDTADPAQFVREPLYAAFSGSSMTKGAEGEKRGPRWAHPIGRRGPRPSRAAREEGAHSLSRLLSSRTPSSENLSHRYVTKSYRFAGRRTPREEALRRQNREIPPEGEIDAIAIVIELDIISIIIIIIIISTIYTAITTAAPRHRCIAMNEVRKKLFSISLSGKAAHWYKLLKNGDSLDWEDIVPLFYSKFYPPSEIHKDRNRIYNFWPHDGESIAQAWGRLKSLMLKCPIHELPGNVIIDNFYARLSFEDKTLLDTSCSGSFTRNKEEFKRDLLDRIQENTEGWENDKDRESGIIFDYKCIEAFMDTDKFRNMSATYGLDSQVVANLYKAFASHYELPKKNFDKYHEPYKDKIDSSVNKCVVIETVDHVIPEAYIEKTPFPAKMKEYSVISSAVNKSEKKPIEPEEQIKVEPAVAIVKDLVTENVEDGHIIFCEDASNIVSHPNKPKQVSVPMLSVRIGDHCYYGLCDIGASVSAIPYELYTEIMHEIDSCELEDIDVVIQLANRETISPIGIVRDVEVLCGKIKYPADFLVLGSAASDYCPIIFGRPFLNTCGAIIDCKKEKILTKFAGESYEFNFSKFTKTPYKADLPSDDFKMEQCASIVLVPNNPLQQHLENSESEVFRKERDELEEIFLRQPILKHDLPVEDLGTTPPPKEDPVFDLKPLPDNLKYAHIDDKKIYPVIISSKLSEIEEERLLEILKKHRGAIGYTLDDLKGISPSICQHAINMEDDAKPVVEHQRRLIPKMKEVVRNEVLKLLEAGIIYPIADSRWVSPVHCVPKKGGMTVVPNDNDELIPQRVVVGYRMCIDFRKVNKVTKKDHYPLPFIDQMLERRMPFGLCNAPATFQRCMSAIFHGFCESIVERCEETNLVLNWEKCHFMVNEGIVLGHKISERGIEVDRAKVEAIEKMPYPRDVKELLLVYFIYNKLKIPGPNGWITVSGDYKKARDCEEGEAAFAESVISGEELQGYRAAVDPTEMQTTKKQISEQKTSFKAAIETKKHDLIEGDNSKQVSVGANMDPK
ncbi:hypothetical protein QYE76_037159 [Lolium multiflorum]|uniref:Retrotransposon gag domain-containing protein n=1 Tax=Lolium multiflorum TaxID=4521 RepID=A0AAD8V2R9_LOLMU|nr:hypothetical protein QYE76_037159 [Lolium multiflorum]